MPGDKFLCLCTFRILNNFSYIDNKLMTEDLLAWQWAFSAWKEAVWCLERGFLCHMNGVYAYFICHYILEQFRLLRQNIFIIEASLAC